MKSKGRHELEGRAERECGLPSRNAAILHRFRRRNLLTAGTEWNGVKGALRSEERTKHPEADAGP